MRGNAQFLIWSLITVLLALPAGAQIQPEAPPIPAELRVRVTYPSDQPAGSGIRVDLLTASGLNITQAFTDELGQITFPRVQPGYYSLKLSGAVIEDLTTPSFHIVRGEGTHYEFVRVQAKDATEGVVTLGSAPPVSAVELNVPANARKEFDDGMTALNLKNWPEAKTHFEKALALYPQYAQASVGLGVVFMNTGEPARGRQAFEAALRSDDHLAAAALNLGLIAYREKRYADAETLLNKSLASDPLNGEALLHLANAQLLLGKPEEAINTARRLHNLEHGQYTLVHLIAARALVTLNRPTEAAAEYQLYLTESPTGPAAANARAALQALQAQTPR